MINMALLTEEKEMLLDLLAELVAHIGLKEKNEFEIVSNITNKEINENYIRMARLRDLQRDGDITHRLEDRKDEILKEIFILCPILEPIIKRIDYTYWSIDKIVRAMPPDIMIASDWENFFGMCEDLIS